MGSRCLYTHPLTINPRSNHPCGRIRVELDFMTNSWIPSGKNMKHDMTIHDNMTMDDNGKSPICIHLHRSLTHQTLDYLFCLPKGFHSIIVLYDKKKARPGTFSWILSEYWLWKESVSNPTSIMEYGYGSKHIKTLYSAQQNSWQMEVRPRKYGSIWCCNVFHRFWSIMIPPHVACGYGNLVIYTAILSYTTYI